MKRALLSVTDKTGIVKFAADLVALGYEIVSTGGTAKVIRDDPNTNIPVTDVTELTGSPECLGGRLKTLDFRLLGGLLFRDTPEDRAQAEEYDLPEIDLLACNLYDFEGAVAGNTSFDEVIEKIDIGGPTMIRAAAKNHSRVTVVVDPTDYEEVIEKLKTNHFVQTMRKWLASKAFQTTRDYEVAIDQWWQA